MPLVVAHGPLLDQIVDLTYPIWNEGLTRRAYAQWNAAQMGTSWGREHLARVALVDDAGALLATAKRYQFRVTLDGREARAVGIGAVFTPDPLRHRGHASRLIELLVDEATTRGDALALLFSENSTRGEQDTLVYKAGFALGDTLNDSNYRTLSSRVRSSFGA